MSDLAEEGAAVCVAPDDAMLGPLVDVSARQGLGPLSQRLAELRSWLSDDLAELEAALVEVEQAQVGLDGCGTRQAMLHLLARRGKQIRPLCVILAARLGGHSMDATVRHLAVACELVHAATLLHDDVIDNSDMRRGAPASRILYGNSASILAGDHLLVEALRRVHQTGHTALVGALLDVISRMVSAEALQLERRGKFLPDRDVYMRVIAGKTAGLFVWGLEAGAQVAQMDAAARKALAGVGHSLGLAFQLVDDVLDLDGDPQQTGKAALADIREGKATWPLILAAERDDKVRQQLMDLAADDSLPLTGAPAQALIDAVRRSGAISATRTLALSQAEAACQQLAALPAGRARTALELVVQSAVYRIT
jgi:octaprenyl-diphosphate synthase